MISHEDVKQKQINGRQTSPAQYFKEFRQTVTLDHGIHEADSSTGEVIELVPSACLYDVAAARS